jgi:SpoVK/Ycf46/Vps4 family AAA+-type ATPase
MTRGAIDVFKASSKWIANYERSISSRPAKRMPVLFDDEAKFGVSNRQGLLRLLRRDGEDVAKER